MAQNYQRFLSEDEFSTERNVIIRSNIAIDQDDWLDYIVKNLDIIPMNSKILILTGFHGMESGEVGKRDESIVEDFEDAIEVLKEEYEDIIRTKNISFTTVDIGLDCSNFQDIDTSLLVQAIEKHDPTMISLGFCFTKVSHINWLLQANGIFSKLLLQQERREITDGKWITLDNEQVEALKKVAENVEIKDLIFVGT